MRANEGVNHGGLGSVGDAATCYDKIVGITRRVEEVAQHVEHDGTNPENH